MKLLFDENLSPRLPQRLQSLFPGSMHVRDVDLKQSPDRIVWEFAGANGYLVVSADADFYELALTFGPPPKIVWLRGCDYPTAVAEEMLRTNAIRIAEFASDSDGAVMILKPDS